MSIIMKDSDLDILAVMETWLVPDVASSFVVVPGYAMVCSYKARSIMKHGACLYVVDRLK